MSCLDFPRVHFRGMFSTNVCTANNDDMGALSHGGQIADEFYPIVDPINATVNANIAKMTRSEARRWFESVAAGKRGLNSGWNYYGDHIVKFENASVSQVQIGPFQAGLVDTALLKAQVSLPGAAKMVDVDPTGSANTQIFFGGFSVGSSDVGITYSNARGRDGLVGYTRWIGSRNISPIAGGFTGATATWQFGIPNGDELTFNGVDQDPALKELADAAAAGRGLLVQFNVYYVQPLLSTTQLQQDFQNGKTTQNPATGHLVGTVGVWQEGDLETLPNGRLLNNADPNPQGVQAYLNPAAVKVRPDEEVLSLNLITTFPEQVEQSQSGPGGPRQPGASAFPSLEKVSFGDLTLAVETAGGQREFLASLAGYDDYDTYTASAGIMDVKFDPAKAPLLVDGDLVIHDASGKVLLREQPFVAESDDHALYMTPGETREIQVNARLRGEPYEGALTISSEVISSTYGFNLRYFPYAVSAVSATFGAVAGPSGTVAGLVTAGAKAALAQLSCRADPGINGVAPALFEVGFRIYPVEDYSDRPAAERSWDEIYEICLKYYDYVFPVMSEILDLSNENLVISQAGAFLYLMQTGFKNPQYMPVTRSMSPAKRQLLIDWLTAKTG